MSMTQNERKRTAIPYRGVRTPSRRAWFSSPRGKATSEQNRREKLADWENSSWIYACN